MVNKRLLRNTSYHLRRRAADHVPNLIRNTRETRTERWGRKFVQVNRDNTPSALDHKLQEERARGEAGLRIGDDPGGDKARCKDACDDDGATTAVGLGDIADDGTADDCTGFSDNCAPGGCLLCESFAGLSGIKGTLAGLDGIVLNAEICTWRKVG